MAGFRTFLKSGHAPTLFAAFLYFDFCFAVWVLNGAMAPFISEAFQLTAAQKGLMISVPIMAGALMRFPLGVLAQYIGRKNATLVEMGLIVVALAVRLLLHQLLRPRAGHGRAAGHRGRQLRRGAVAGLGLVSAEVQGPGDGHRRRRQLRHRAGRAVRAAAGHGLRLAGGLRRGRVLHADPDGGDGRVRQGAAGHRAPDLPRAHRLPVREGRLGLQPDLRHHLRRLHRPGQLPAHLLPRPVRRDQGAGGPADHAGGVDGLGQCAWWAAASPTAGAASTR